MKIVIVGSGTVGIQLVSRLSREEHDIIVVDQYHKLRDLEEMYDIGTVYGDGTSVEVLRQATTETADLVVGVTESDSTNVLICQLAKKLGAKYTTARMRKPGLFDDPNLITPLDLGVDMVVYPEKMAAKYICELIARPFAQQSYRFLEEKLEVLELTLTKNHRMDGLDIEGIRKRSEKPFLIVTIMREGNAFIPVNRRDEFKAGDKIYLAVHCDFAVDVAKDLGFEVKPVERLFIHGGTEIGMDIARRFEETSIQVNIIESNRNRTKEMAYELTNALVLHGEGTDKNLLESEGVPESDFFIAVTDDENNNILSCLLAKKLGAQRNVTMVNNPDYVSLDRQLSIDTLISQRLSTINKVMRFVRQGNIIGVNEIVEGQIQALEFRVTTKCPLVGKVFRSGSFREVFPANVIVAGIIREGVAFTPDGETELIIGDGVLLFAPNEFIGDLEAVFPV